MDLKLGKLVDLIVVKDKQKNMNDFLIKVI